MVNEALATSEDAARAALYHYAVRKMDAAAEPPGPATQPPESSTGSSAAAPAAAAGPELQPQPAAAAEAEGARPAAAPRARGRGSRSSPWEPTAWDSTAVWFRMAQNVQLYLE